MASSSSSLVMYLILRRDLISELKWPVGAVATQAAHAASAAMWLWRDDPETRAYAENLDHMHKVTLGVDSADQLEKVRQKLETGGHAHKVWIEDEMPVCIATKPAQKQALKKAVAQLKLF